MWSLCSRYTDRRTDIFENLTISFVTFLLLLLLLSHFEVIVCFLISYSNQKFVPFLDGYWSYYHLQSSLVRNRSIHFALGLVDSSFFMQRSLSPAGRIFVDLYKRNTFSRVLSSKFYIRENTKNSKKIAVYFMYVHVTLCPSFDRTFLWSFVGIIKFLISTFLYAYPCLIARQVSFLSYPLSSRIG